MYRFLLALVLPFLKPLWFPLVLWIFMFLSVYVMKIYEHPLNFWLWPVTAIDLTLICKWQSGQAGEFGAMAVVNTGCVQYPASQPDAPPHFHPPPNKL